MNNETLIFQLVDDLSELFSNDPEYYNTTVKKSYDGDDNISYPLVIIRELSNSDVGRYYDGREHIVGVGYQFEILADQSIDKDAEENVRCIQALIRDYMRGERYCALKRVGPSPITKYPEDTNIKIGYMRYNGLIDIDNNIIYRRN